MSPNSIGSYAQTAEMATPPKREQTESTAERATRENETQKIISDPDEGRGVGIDLQT